MLTIKIRKQSYENQLLFKQRAHSCDFYLTRLKGNLKYSSWMNYNLSIATFSVYTGIILLLPGK